MQKNPAKVDCTRIPRVSCTGRRGILVLALVWFAVELAAAQAPPGVAHPAPPQNVPESAPAMRADPAKYPEIGRLQEGSYCNPFFGFRISLPLGLKLRRLHLPVQPASRHMLLALRYSHLDRPAEMYVTAFPDATPGAARLAAAAHRQELQQKGASGGELSEITVGGRMLQRLRAAINARDGNELNFYLESRGWVVRFEIHTLDRELEAALAAQVDRVEFAGKDGVESFCADGPLYYGPALPTELVAERIAQPPQRTVPEGEFQERTFTAPYLGLRVMLPERWQVLSPAERERLPELLAEPEKNRRHELLRACSRVLFGAYDPLVEPVSGVHPALAVSAMPLGCVPGLIPPSPSAAPEILYDFGHALLDGLGLGAAGEWKMRPASGSYSLYGAIPYRVPGEAMARRLTVRVSAAVRGEHLLLFYAVTTSPAGQRELDNHIRWSAPTTNAAR